MAAQSPQITDSDKHNDAVHLLCCPHCNSGSLVEDHSGSLLCCDNCQHQFPIVSFGDSKIPFLFSDVIVAQYDWLARIKGFEKKSNEDFSALANSLKDKSLTKLSRERLKKVLNAKKQYLTQILEHLKYFQLLANDNSISYNSNMAKNQGVDSYINNIFRDWSWNNGENEEMLLAVDQIIDEKFHAGQSVTLGAGACRFSYDFHQKYQADHSVLIDINPMLLGYAKRILNHEKVNLYEFPIAPLTNNDFCLQQEFNFCGDYNQDEFTFILADGLNAPLKSKQFDSLLTPWFIDIIPVDFKDLISHVSRLLKVGGSWINTGSLAFFHANQQWNYSEQEICDLLKKYGFSNIKMTRCEINYLHSPYSAHGRRENVFSFSAVKKFDTIKPKEVSYLPEWIQHPNKTIPEQSNYLAASSKYLLQAQVLSAIDGKRSINEIGDLLARQYGMSQQQAIAAVRQILKDNL